MPLPINIPVASVRIQRIAFAQLPGNIIQATYEYVPLDNGSNTIPGLNQTLVVIEEVAFGALPTNIQNALQAWNNRAVSQCTADLEAKLAAYS